MPTQDTSQSALSAMPEESTAGSMPFRARLSLLRQRFILTIRWWFRLPIDEFKERNTQSQIAGLVQLNEKAMETVQTLVRISGQLHARMAFYEKHIPRMREVGRAFDKEQARLKAQATATTEADLADLNNGILPIRQIPREFDELARGNTS